MLSHSPAVTAALRLFSAIQKMLEVNFGDRVGVDASVDEAASIEAVSECRVVMQAAWIR